MLKIHQVCIKQPLQYDLEDTITEDIITSAFQEAMKKPSKGVCFFWWVHALEKGKTGIIKNLFSSFG